MNTRYKKTFRSFQKHCGFRRQLGTVQLMKLISNNAIYQIQSKERLTKNDDVYNRRGIYSYCT